MNLIRKDFNVWDGKTDTGQQIQNTKLQRAVLRIFETFNKSQFFI